MVPAKTVSPSDFSTGMDSPVMGAWFTVEWPLVTTPSRATFSPGRTRTMLPTATSRISMASQLPSACRTVALSGARASSSRMALRALSRDFASMASERLKRTMTMAASGNWPMRTAPVTATAMRAFMLRFRLETASQPFL